MSENTDGAEKVEGVQGEQQAVTHVAGGIAAMLNYVFKAVPLAEPIDVSIARDGKLLIVVAEFGESVMPALDEHMRKNRVKSPDDVPPVETITDKNEIEKALADSIDEL